MAGGEFVTSIDKDDDGYFAHIPSIQGCYAQGDTYEEVLTNIQEVLHLILEEDGADRCNRPAEPIQDFTI
ncbi:MAG: type II toxin-antitoxin system HicB family antitoxin [Methanocalculus sp.]|uniref:type II toxin-antitoxin system HicB family antitoxin n=1 Tax=Methanocalculus sp. TaxID=2004547 RepID=UPI002723DFCC|nr:type II toxin-antitoxin system HicB family antitoxin [Methanocalculus sp.]MDO9540675.1 type II toxin-antitoxin system HicB family antitoxin [Methanocalculus sp.]